MSLIKDTLAERIAIGVGFARAAMREGNGQFDDSRLEEEDGGNDKAFVDFPGKEGAY